jgi:hypothetical protein
MLDDDRGPFRVVDENGGMNITRRGYHYELGTVIDKLDGKHECGGGERVAVWGADGASQGFLSMSM